MGTVVFIVVGIITVTAFWLYDRTQQNYIKSLKECVTEQTNVIHDQQRIINALYTEKGETNEFYRSNK